MIDLTLAALSTLLQLWLFLICTRREDIKCNQPFAKWLPAYCLCASSLLWSAVIMHGFYRELNGWLSIGQDAIVGLLCMDLAYSMVPAMKKRIGLCFEISLYASIASFVGYWWLPWACSAFCGWVAFVGCAGLMATLLWAPESTGERYKWLALAVVTLQGMHGLHSIMYEYIGHTVTVSRIGQISWMAALVLVGIAIRRFPTSQAC